MPRRARMYLPGYVYHIVQRGNNREACFFEEENYRVYLNLMFEVLPRYGNRLHAYCLMTNHIHLLITPADRDGISRLMRVVGSRYACYVNKRYSRSGTLWEGRHKSSAVDTDGYLLKCYRYIELNPVAAHMVARPEEYPWSSFAANAWGKWDPVVTPHDCYLGLGVDEKQRQHAYRELVHKALSPEDIHAFHQASHYSMPLGSASFIRQIEQKMGRPLGQSYRGRPRKLAG